LDLSEFLRKIADVRLGLALGFLKAKDEKAFDEFMGDMRPAAFCLNNNLDGENERFYDEVRAETVGSVLPNIVQVVRRG
jgi:protein-arginine kinase